MTSITHSATSASLPSLGLGRFRFGADSKAVRMGLGVAIAAVMAGDVYAVLRSPVAEGSTSAQRGTAASSAALDGGVGGVADGGYVATNPFSEAAYGADLATRFAGSVSAAGVGSTSAASVPAESAPVLTAPASTLPTLPAPAVGTIAPTVAPPTETTKTPDDSASQPEPGLLAPVVEVVPEAEPIAAIVEEVVAEAPLPESDAESTSTEVATEPVALPSLGL